jgi:hypothetical protein
LSLLFLLVIALTLLQRFTASVSPFDIFIFFVDRATSFSIYCFWLHPMVSSILSLIAPHHCSNRMVINLQFDKMYLNLYIPYHYHFVFFVYCPQLWVKGHKLVQWLSSFDVRFSISTFWFLCSYINIKMSFLYFSSCTFHWW